MPWYSPWSDHIAKSVCKYLLQRYLGQFLEEKLTLDQLTVDLYKGIGVISDVALDVQALNEVAEQQNIPFEFTDGFIEKMSVSVPWSSIMSNATNIQVEGLSLTIKKTERDKARVSMFESMWSSMTSSMQLAEDCLKSEREKGSSADENSTFEGIESFAHTIDSILSRIKVKFIRTVIRLEEINRNYKFGVAFEINIKLMEYFDEAAVEAEEAQQDFHLSALTTKKIYLDGVTFFSDEFPVSILADSKLTCPGENTDTSEGKSGEGNEGVSSVLVAQFAGRQEVTMRFKQEGVEGPKIDLQISLGALTAFLSPRQAHNLMIVLSGVTSSHQGPRGGKNQCLQKPMEESDFRKIEQELQMNLNQSAVLQPKGLRNQTWANTCLDGSEYEFAPLHNSSRLNDSVISSSSSLSSSVMSVSSRSSHCQAQTPVLQPKRKTHSGGIAESDSNAVVFHFHVLLSSLSVVLLHEDILTLSADSTRVTIGKSSFEEMRRLAEEFFEGLGLFAASGYGNKDFENVRQVFSTVCQLNHLRYTAAPIIVEGSETSTSHASVIKGKLTASSMELIECLLEKETHSQKLNVEYVELLKFKSSEKKDSHQFFSRPNLTLNFRLAQTNSHSERNRRYIQPKSDFSFELQPFETEIDVTIVDRISALLRPDVCVPKTCHFNLSSSSADPPLGGGHAQQVVDHHSIPNLKQDIKINSSFITFKVRFPVPDLRPMHDMDKTPWWKRSVRKDILYLDVADFSLHTVVDGSKTVSKYEIQFRDVVVKFKEADADGPVEFAKASAAHNCGTLTGGGQGFGWPRLVVHLYPRTSAINLEETELSTNSLKTSHNLGYQSVVTTLENTTKKEHSPFSCKKIVHESDTPHENTSGPERDGEELIIPGDNAEITDFIEVASLNTRIKFDITLPTASVTLPSKHLYEVIYNRISSDLLLWEPSAPVHDGHSTNTTFDYDHSHADFLPTFSLCKSAVLYDSDSDGEVGGGGVFYSVHEQKQRYKKKQLLESKKLMGQSKVVMQLSVLQGVCDVYAPVRDSQGKVIPRQHGELHLSVEEGTLFLVSGYRGKSDLDYLCVQVNHFSFYHSGLVSDGAKKPEVRAVGCPLPPHLELTVQKTEKCALIDQSTSVGVGSCRSLDMLTVSVKVQKNQLSEGLKTFRVAVGIREATLRHKVCAGQSSWFTQLIDFFDVADYPIAGYEPSCILSEMNVHLWNCAVDYRPVHLPLRCVLTVGNLNISSNIAAQTSSSTLRFIAEEAGFFLSNRAGAGSEERSADLRRDYVCVMELGLFELSLRLSERNESNPKVDLRASANVAHLRTCSDSAKALAELLMYFASDGDLTSSEGDAEKAERPNGKGVVESQEQLLVKTGDGDGDGDGGGDGVEGLSKSQVALVNDLMEEAMKESKVVEQSSRKSGEGPGKTIYYERRRGEGGRREEGEEQEREREQEQEQQRQRQRQQRQCLGLGLEVGNEVNGFEGDDKDSSWEEEFCIVQDEAGLGMLPKKGLPEVRNLTGAPIRLVDNHFSIPLGKPDLLRSPKHYPRPVLRYMLREMSLVWHMYGGSDFDEDPQTVRKRYKIKHSLGSASPEQPSASEPVVAFCKNFASGVSVKTKGVGSMNWKRRGGICRRHDVLMELQLNKVRFQHEVYPENTAEASRQVLLIQELELRDRLATSTINKFLYQYSSEAKPKQSQAPMVVVKSVLMRSDPKVNTQECCLKVSLLPLRLNVDQDSVLFLYRFFGELAGDTRDEEEDCTSRAHTPKHQVPVMTVNVAANSDPGQPEPPPLLIDLEGEGNPAKAEAPTKTGKKTSVARNRPPPQPLFFRCFIFSPEVPVRLDYQGKRVDMSHGSLAGILMGLGQLNNSELRLRKISYKHGLLGFDRLMNFVLSEWANDIKKNQLPSLLGGVGPIHSLVQLIQGIRDLFWLPIEQYQKDGRLVRGFQRGANSFTTSTAMASLEIISRLIHIIQTTAETAYDMVSPGPSVRTKGKGKCKRYSQPADIREGMAIAYLVVKEGIGETAETIVRVASEEHEQKGVTGAVGGVLRQIPPTVVKPIILATEATNNVIGGMRSQLVPDARKEAVEKWRRQDL